MCVCGKIHVMLPTLVVLLVSTVAARASSYMRGHGVKASELWPHFRNTCNLTCPYGYQTDVEGNFVCQCHDPCQNVLCFWKTRCVVELPKSCTGTYCRPKATCKDVTESSQSPLPHGVLQADDAATTSAETSYPERCMLPVTGEAKKCRKMRLRWYFDSVTGACKQFLGCRTKGNNFKRSRGCERMCLGIKSGPSSRTQPRSGGSALHVQQDDANLLTLGHGVKGSKVRLTLPAACHVPPVPVTTGCRKVRRRWFFDTTSGTCRKFRSCPTAGNNFRKRRHCKNRCLRLGKTSRRRKGRRGQFHSVKQ
ncbi:kunitz-type protease inhibitor 2-like [Babylonia areolata]|uniref:kunitz-type protease inhibitor 2-like n=1 Tax=Babylonia areolata TaxID=304850 RepID=UPI003FCFB170